MEADTGEKREGRQNERRVPKRRGIGHVGVVLIFLVVVLVLLRSCTV